jgi:hypothetical protein
MVALSLSLKVFWFFDLAMLHLAILPLLAHDSVMLKHIADEAIEKILLLYSKTPKPMAKKVSTPKKNRK